MKNKRTFSNVEELINAIKHGYELTKDDLINHPYLCKSDEVILHVIDNINPNMVRYYKGNNVRVLEYAIDKGYTPIEEDLKKYNYINNKNIILKAIDSISPNMIKYYNGKDKEVFKYAIDKDVNCLNYINVQLSDELYKYAVEEKNYKIDLSIIMGKWTFINSLYMMKKAIDKDKIAIKYYEGRDEEVFEYAIQKGYVPKEEDLINAYHLCKSKSIIKKSN